MIAEALKFLAEQALAGVRVERVSIDDPRHAYFHVNDKLREMVLPVPPRNHAVSHLDEILRLAARFQPEPEPESDADSIGTPVVWYEREAVVLVIDDNGHRCERATLELVESETFRVVKLLAPCPRESGKGSGTLAVPQSFDQKAFVRLLRVDLAGTLAPSLLLDIVRRVKFEAGTTTTAEIRKSRESLGREITSAVSAEADIPDEVVLSVPVFRTAGETDPVPIRCVVDVDPMEGRFRLIPYPDEIERAYQLAMARIARRLESGLPGSVPCYMGRP